VRALAEGHEVTALARRPAALDELRDDRLSVIEGDARHRPAVERCVGEGVDGS
jgi:uncharacterized protein YbjT (DUF2867 family)